jgi:hypothetical protein
LQKNVNGSLHETSFRLKDRKKRRNEKSFIDFWRWIIICAHFLLQLISNSFPKKHSKVEIPSKHSIPPTSLTNKKIGNFIFTPNVRSINDSLNFKYYEDSIGFGYGNKNCARLQLSKNASTISHWIPMSGKKKRH